MPNRPQTSQSFLAIIVTLAVTLLFWSIETSADYYSIKYSKKNQLRTGMLWIRLRPQLVLATSLEPAELKNNRRGKKKGSKAVTDQSLAVAAKKIASELPYSAAGKLFFTNDEGKISTCSAAFAGASNLIVTAAHCVMNENGHWYDDFIFIRSFGTNKQDLYSIHCVATPSEWGDLHGEKIFDYDYAFLRTNRITKGGSLGITNGAPPESLTLVGYSDNYNNGLTMLSIDVENSSDEPGQLRSQNNPLGKGSSGMPWLSLSTVYSVTSHYRAKEEDTMWGPRLTKNTMDLISYTRNGCENL